MDGEAVRRIIELADERRTLEMPDGTYTRGSYHKIFPEVSHPKDIGMTTLASFVGFAGTNPQGFDLDGAVVTIDEDFVVDLVSPPRADGCRDHYASARCPIEPFAFGQWYGLDSFNIALLTLFVQDEKLMDLFSLMQEIRIEDGVTMKDNGRSITVTTRSGVSAASDETRQVPSIVKLRPYRYFPEADQVEVPLLLRLEKAEGSGVRVSLHECDGGAWRIEAYQAIERKLKGLGCSFPICY